MFSFKKDKTGFFSTLSLIILVAATLITTGILLAQGIKEGNWEYYSIPIKIVLAVFWLVGMTIVLTRIGVFAVQRANKKIEELQSGESPAPQPDSQNTEPEQPKS
ncbi:MAG: hypothetical protein CK551_01370 [Planctomycetaceae bacterium]|nr:hypothetical protein [Gemmataceae bacterium]PHX64361.1 MAG: hypothetical protein CK551_01370 [Planctomycetaceae bacterium]